MMGHCAKTPKLSIHGWFFKPLIVNSEKECTQKPADLRLVLNVIEFGKKN
jgi:hypothetical protein